MDEYPIVSIEDGMDETTGPAGSCSPSASATKCNWWATILFVTNPKILAEGIEAGVANALFVKVNQIGTLSETLQAVELAKRNRYTCVMSHRSGETEDSTIADLAVSTNCMQIKTGSLSRSEPHRQIQPPLPRALKKSWAKPLTIRAKPLFTNWANKA